MKLKSGKNRWKWYQLIGITVLCFVFVMLSYNITSAWFMDESTTSNGGANIDVIGTIDLEVTSNFDFYNLALAPDTVYTTDQKGVDIGTYLCTSTKNNIKEVYVRIKFTNTREDGAGGSHINCTELALYFNNNLTTATSYTSTENNKWVYNSADGYYYYLGKVGTTKVQFNAGYITDNTITNSSAGSKVNIRMVVEAIQRPYGAYKSAWETAPTIFNSFALADSGY